MKKASDKVAPPRSNFFHFHAVFNNNLVKNRFLTQTQGWRLPVWEILDPPLENIHYKNIFYSNLKRVMCILVEAGYSALTFIDSKELTCEV